MGGGECRGEDGAPGTRCRAGQEGRRNGTGTEGVAAGGGEQGRAILGLGKEVAGWRGAG